LQAPARGVAVGLEVVEGVELVQPARFRRVPATVDALDLVVAGPAGEQAAGLEGDLVEGMGHDLQVGGVGEPQHEHGRLVSAACRPREPSWSRPTAAPATTTTFSRPSNAGSSFAAARSSRCATARSSRRPPTPGCRTARCGSTGPTWPPTHTPAGPTPT